MEGKVAAVDIPAKPQIELSGAMACALQASIERVNVLSASLQNAAAVRQVFVAALIEQAGMKPEDFPQYGVFEENGKLYLKAQ